MKSLVFILALLVLTGINGLKVQSVTSNQRQNSTKQVSGTLITTGEVNRATSKLLGEERSEGRMEDQQITALKQMVDAVNASDAQRYARLYVQDAVITIYGGGELKGRSAIEQYEVELLREFPGTRFAFYSIWQQGTLAVVHYGVNGRAASGQAMGHEGLLFYRFHPSGLIEQEHRYLDSMTPMAQMGVLGTAPARNLPTLPSESKVHATKSSPEEEKNIGIVKASFAALDAKNESAFLATIADDAVLDELIYPQPFIGKRNVKAWFETWTKAIPDAATQITTILGAGEFVLVESIVRGTLKGPFGRLVASSKPFAIHRAVIVQVKGGKLIRVSCFMNSKELAEAVGQWPPPMGK